MDVKRTKRMSSVGLIMSPTRNGWRNLFLDIFFYDFPLLICKLALESDYVGSQEDSRESTEARPDMFASQNKAAREEFFVHFLCAKRHGKHVDKRRKSLFQVTVFALEIFFLWPCESRSKIVYFQRLAVAWTGKGFHQSIVNGFGHTLHHFNSSQLREFTKNN